MVNNEIQNIESKIEALSNKVIKIESEVSRIDKSKEFDYEKMLSAIRYLYRYYDDMTKDTEITTSVSQ
jgi:predicted  nucleic acid-binding Zn-ribbon protein